VRFEDAELVFELASFGCFQRIWDLRDSFSAFKAWNVPLERSEVVALPSARCVLAAISLPVKPQFLSKGLVAKSSYSRGSRQSSFK